MPAINALDKTLIISKRWSTGRGRHTSVERFCELLDPQFPTYHGQRQHVHPRIARFFKGRTNSRRLEERTAPYNSYSFELELWGLKKSISMHPRYIFFPYADYDFYYWQYFKRFTGAKIILWSFFSRKELRERFENLRHFARADLVLAAGYDQVNFISEQISETRVAFFPIGVDTDFFKPGQRYQQFRLVHIGLNRRDFGTLVKALDLVYEEYPQIQVDLIGAFKAKESIPPRPYLHIHEFIDDEEFLSIMQQANFSLLALEDGGSSNSLLETSACGLPVVATKLPNVSDYLDVSYALLFEKGDCVTMSRQIKQLLSNTMQRDQMAAAARLHAAQYSWSALKNKFVSLLNHLGGNG